jgi:hypothetical protein
MNKNTAPQPNRHHQPETVSTASLQGFEDPAGRLPVDSPVVLARQQQQRGRPPGQKVDTTNSDRPKEGPGKEIPDN